MSEDHEQMVEALRVIVIPKLRALGFKGSFPHFRRPGEGKIDLLSFQFDRRGGGFVIEISSCPLDGILTHWGERIPPGKVRAWDMHPNDRLRLQARQGSSLDDWFRYDKPCLFGDVFEKTAKQVLPWLELAEAWWQGR